MIKNIESIANLGVFQDFDWDEDMRAPSGKVQYLQAINIIYGRNYSGKTTLSRILRAMETGQISDKYENPSFCVGFTDGSKATEASLTDHGRKIRVFNEDFVRENLRFISNPSDNVVPFAILGEDNNKIEREIEVLEEELGLQEQGHETGLYAQRADARKRFAKHREEHQQALAALEKQLSDKATDKKIGIKYQFGRYGDQNYTVVKLKTEIGEVLKPAYVSASEDQLATCEKLTTETILQTIAPFVRQSLRFSEFTREAETLVTRKISESDKIEALVKDAVLNRWVSDGRIHHKGRIDACGFCGGEISSERWAKLDKHFDEESNRLERDLDSLIAKIETEINSLTSAASVNSAFFYSKFHAKLLSLEELLKGAVDLYIESLKGVATQLKYRKNDLLNQREFQAHDDATKKIHEAWEKYDAIRLESLAFSSSLKDEQAKASKALRLNEIEKYLTTIRYAEKQLDIQTKLESFAAVEKTGKNLSKTISAKEQLLSEKRRELNDEEKGAKKVNEYLNDFFGHRFLTLEAKKEDLTGEGSKRMRFEVIRDGKKAYHLSEGECSLLAFCYFLAKLDDIDTKNAKPIVWIDDPISSLDGNHIFFIYSLLNAEVVLSDRFAQLFVSTHNLDFLKYLKRLADKYIGADGKEKQYQKSYLVTVRQDTTSKIAIMPTYLKEHGTEFNYLFQQIYKCANIEVVDDTNYEKFYNFANNARKFLEIYLFYKFPDRGMNAETLQIFFGEGRTPSVLAERIYNEYSHLNGTIERGSRPIEVPEMQTAARKIIERLKEDRGQYASLVQSIGEIEAI